MESEQVRYDAMLAAIREHAPNTDLAAVNRAYEYARAMHENQKRKDGSPYIIHPLAVAEIVAGIGLDTDTILGALLHDCIEDTRSTYEDIEKNFGTTVADLVEGVTKLTRVQYSTEEEQQMENLRKMFLAMSRDIRVIIIKICDRLHNMRTLEYQSHEKQIIKSNETMEIYAPLAYRLGMQQIKGELEDTSLRYLDPEGYQQITNFLQEHKEEVDTFMKGVEEKILARLAAVGIEGNFSGRVKHVSSIYRKMDRQRKGLDQIYDLYAFRVIVNSISDCYNVLGHIHDLFSPVPGRFKDYISTPKTNGYQSLHTTVIGEE
ncbi:MAG: bifunctional (p)ppGpp synthetase/guanosine-3',5'-bis(diphosphate) 3'-pyrophosphohydrolase, partial [Oscillospiraceae bacterium]|nr:bifunctional (p)ppGpp synthetase/guanosine-3',5'-bis(diphosphate) 3'-pyrophosphohydrolase [Oscillospiraceae bacterium]